MDISQRTTQLKTRNRGFWERMFGVWEEVTVSIFADHINTFLVRTYLALIVLIAKTYQKSQIIIPYLKARIDRIAQILLQLLSLRMTKLLPI